MPTIMPDLRQAMSGRTPSTANTAASRMPAAVMTPPVAVARRASRCPCRRPSPPRAPASRGRCCSRRRVPPGTGRTAAARRCRGGIAEHVLKISHDDPERGEEGARARRHQQRRCEQRAQQEHQDEGDDDEHQRDDHLASRAAARSVQAGRDVAAHEGVRPGNLGDSFADRPDGLERSVAARGGGQDDVELGDISVRAPVSDRRDPARPRLGCAP